ncbi:MAG: hypothetical protein ACTHLW_06510 [Verrucomicrobiota bacterium]
MLARMLAPVSCSLVLAVQPLAFAEPTISPEADEARIVGSRFGDQVAPELALDANGGYLVWQDNSVNSLGLRIMAQRLDSQLTPSGAPIAISSVVKSKKTADQEKAKVALTQEGAVVTWQGGKVGFQQIYARFIDANGLPVKSDLRVSARTKNAQITPAVATLVDGSVVVVWSSFGQDDASNLNPALRGLQGVFGQRFSATGAKLGREFQLNQTVANNQRNPAIAALANGNFVVVWISELQRGPASVDVVGRMFDPTGNALADEFAVNLSTNNVCANPTVVASPQGGFAVAWAQKDNGVLTIGVADDVGIRISSTNGVIAPGIETELSSSSWDVFARIYGSNGLPLSPFRINTYWYGDQFAPRLGVIGESYLAVWTSLGQDGSREGVFGQLFSSEGDLEGGEIAVNTTTISQQHQPVVASNGVDRFMAVWSGFVKRNGFDLFARSYLFSTP